MKKKLVIITNESFGYNNDQFFCDNIDLKSIPEGLEEKFDIEVIGEVQKFQEQKRLILKKLK